MSDKKNIMIISALDYWSMGDGKGGPALYQTILGYAKRGWKVWFITGNRISGGSDNLHDNIHVIRFDVPLMKRLLQVKKVRFFIKLIWWPYFQTIAFIKAKPLMDKKIIDIVYGYESQCHVHSIPVSCHF